MKKNYVIVAASLGLAQLALLSAAAHAQDTTRALSDVVVTATRSPKKLSETGRVVTIISAKDISRSQGKTLTDLLNNVPGATFSGAHNARGISSSLFFRGYSSGNILVLVDGFPVNNAGFIDGSYDLNSFPIDQIDHIEILKGSGSTLYGSDAVAGVINIITKHIKENGLTGDLQFKGGSYNTFTESGGLNGKINNTGIAINLSNTDSRGFSAATDTTGKANFKKDGFHQRAASVNLTQFVSKKFTLNGNLQTTYNTGNLPYTAFTDDKNNTYNNTFLFGGLGGKLLLDKGTLVFNISQNDVWYKFNDLPNEANYQTPSSQNNLGKITNAEAVFNYSLCKHVDITSGADFKYSYTHQYAIYGKDTTDVPGSNTIASIYTSLFFKAGIFHMELGGRYNHHSSAGNNFNYTINPSVFLFDQLKVFGTVASAFKAPSLYQLISIYGNKTLKPETTTSYEAGFDWEIVKRMLSFNTVFYKNNTKSVIYFKDLPDTPPFGVYENGAGQNDKGFESELKLTGEKFKVSAYVAYVSGQLTNAQGQTTDTLIRRPKTSFGANAYYQVDKHFSAGLTYKYTGERIDDTFDPITFATIPVPLKHYNLVDAHLQYMVDTHINLFADVNNVFNEKYTDWVGYNTSGINFMAGIKYQFN